MPNIPHFVFPCVFSASLFVHVHPIEIKDRASDRLDQTEREQASLHNIVENKNKKANIWSASRRSFIYENWGLHGIYVMGETLFEI